MSRTFVAVRSEHATLGDLTVVRGHEGFLRDAGLDSLEALFGVADGDFLGKPGLDSWRERIRLKRVIEGQEQTFYLKRFLRPPARSRREAARAGARSVAGMEWLWMQRLESNGIRCVRPIAFGEELRGGRERRSAILSAAVPGRSLEAWMREWKALDRGRTTSLIEETADLVARFHARGYVHRDLYLSHLFHDASAQPGQSIHLIDMQRVMRPRWRMRRWIVKDLAALNYSTPSRLITRADRLRWLKRYLGIPKLDGAARVLTYRLLGKTQRMVHHDARRMTRE